MGMAKSVSLAVEPSIIGCPNVGALRCCLPFAGVDAQMAEIFDPPFAGVRAH